MKTKTLFFLSKKFFKSQDRIFYSEIISIFFTFVIVTIVLSLMNGLQQKQFEVLRNLTSFPLCIKNVNENEYQELQESVFNNYNSASTYRYNDYKMLSKNTNETAVLRIAEYNYFISSEFKNNFYYFPYSKLLENEVIVPYENNKGYGEYYYLKEGESNGQIISSIYTDSENAYYSKYATYEKMFYKINDNFNSDNSTFNVGIFLNEKDAKMMRNEIKKEFPTLSLSSYKDETSDVYSALMIEKTMLFLVMLFLLLIVFMSFQKSISSLILSKKGEVIILRTFGLLKKEIFSIFLLSYTLPILLSECLGVLFSFLLIKTNAINGLLHLLSSSFFKNNSLLFIINFNELIYMVFISFLIYFILVFFSIKAVSNININEVSKDE